MKNHCENNKQHHLCNLPCPPRFPSYLFLGYFSLLTYALFHILPNMHYVKLYILCKCTCFLNRTQCVKKATLCHSLLLSASRAWYLQSGLCCLPSRYPSAQPVGSTLHPLGFGVQACKHPYSLVYITFGICGGEGTSATFGMRFHSLNQDFM